MSQTILQKVPVGEKVGIAFFWWLGYVGGIALDEKTKGLCRMPIRRIWVNPMKMIMRPFRAPCDVPMVQKRARLVECRPQLVAEGIGGHSVRRFPYHDCRRDLL